MMYPLYDFKKRENVANSNVIAISEEAREILHYLNKTIYMLTSQYDEVLQTTSITDNLNKLSYLHKMSSDILNKPSFVISTIGTTSSGKSTFVNALLGSKLSPMSADELSVGSLRFDYNDSLKNNCNITIESQISNKFWENGTVNKSFSDSYKYIRNIMETYRSEVENEKLSPPHITVETSYLVGNNPVFLGLDPNVQLEIMELPWMIIDSESIDFISSKVKSSLIVFLIDYTVLFNKETRETNLLFKKLMDMKKDVGNTDAVVFVLNKIDLKNYEDDELEIVLNKCKKEIKKRLNINEDIKVIPLNSLLMYYLQTAYLSYENGNLSGTYNPDSSIELVGDQKMHFEIIRDSLKKCFKDQARVISDIQDSTEDNIDMISEIKRNLKKDKIPTFPIFKKFWQECLKRCGSVALFDDIRTKSKANIRNLLLYYPLSNIIHESNSLLLGVKEQIKLGKKRDKENIASQENHVLNVFTELKEKLENFRNEINGIVAQSLKEIRVSDNRTRSKAVDGLDVGQIEEIIPSLKNTIKRENIFPIEKAFINEIRPDTLENNLIKEHTWNKDFSKQISEHFDFLRMKLFSEKKYIEEGRKFIYSIDDEYEKQKLNDIENQFNELCKYIVYAIDERLKFEVQNTIDELSIRVNRWLNKKVREIHEILSETLKKFETHHNFDLVNPNHVKSYKYQGFFYDKFILSPSFSSGRETVETKVVEAPKKAWYQFWIPDAPVLEAPKQNEFTNYSSVKKQSDSWSNSLYALESNLWNIVCDSLDSFFKKAFDNYDLAISDMYKQIESIVAFENNKIQEKISFTNTKWNNIDNIYLQINKLTDKMYDVSETPKPDRTIYTRAELEIEKPIEQVSEIVYEEPVIEEIPVVYEEQIVEQVIQEPIINHEEQIIEETVINQDEQVIEEIVDIQPEQVEIKEEQVNELPEEEQK